MTPIRSAVYNAFFAAIFVCALAGLASGQNIIATIPIPAVSIGQVAVDPALNLVFSGGNPNAGTGSSLTIINGVTFTVTKTITPSAGVSVDMLNDNIWTGDLSAGDVVVYAASNDTEISSTKVGSCPAAVSFDCHRRMWVASECGTGSDPVWVFEANTLKLMDGPITPGGTIAQPPVVNPNTEKLYVTSGGVSREIDPTTFAVTNTTFGTVLAIDSNTNKLFATSGSNLQIILGHTETIKSTVTLTYTPSAMGVNNALGHVYLVNTVANSIDVYSEAGKKVTTFLLEAGNQPHSLAVDSARGRLYVEVFNQSAKSWSMDVIEDLSSVRLCAVPGSCDY